LDDAMRWAAFGVFILCAAIVVLVYSLARL